MDESLPISRKDTALNSLVNFANLGSEKQEGEEEKEKPIYIKPSDQAPTGFIPQATPQVSVSGEQSNEIKAITF